MRLLATFLVTLSCVCALIIPPPHRAIAKDDANLLELQGHPEPIYDQKSGRGNGESPVIIAHSIANSTNSTTTYEKNQDSKTFMGDSSYSTGRATTRETDGAIRTWEEAHDSPVGVGAKPASPADEEIDAYNYWHPHNQIPDFVYCYHPYQTPVTPTRFDRRHIWRTLQEARRLRRAGLARRPRFAGVRHPHVVVFSEMRAQTHTHVRRLNLGRVRGDPYMFPILMGAAVFGQGHHPRADRILFDEEGAYIGAMTFRRGYWFWCIPVRLPANAPARGASGAGQAGVDEVAMAFPAPPVTPWIDGADPLGAGSQILVAEKADERKSSEEA